MGFYRDSSFAVWRWGDTAFLVIGLYADLSLSKNLHVHPPGYAFWRHGAWLARPQAYTGFDKSAITEDECKRNTVPCGVFTGAWRMHPPKISVMKVTPDTVIIRYGRVTRSYIVGDGTLSVEDL
jgi:hypothetical protein